MDRPFKLNGWWRRGGTTPTSTRGSCQSIRCRRGRCGVPSKIKYLRTLATEVTYLALLLRELRRADIVHVFSASYSSFLLAPLPAMLMARMRSGGLSS